MKKLVILATKNIFRNKRRSIITAVAIAFGVFIMVNALSYVAGLYDGMVDVVLNMGIGHIQIHRRGYMQALEDKAFSSTLVISEEEIDILLKNDKVAGSVKAVARRLIFTGLLGNGEDTTGGLALGFDPQIEKDFFKNLSISEGAYLSREDARGILISQRVKRVFGLNVGDRLRIAAQTTEGVFGADDFIVVGIFDLGTEFGFRYLADILMNIEDARALIHSNQLTEVALLLNHETDTHHVVVDLLSVAKDAYLDIEVHSWRYIGKCGPTVHR